MPYKSKEKHNQYMREYRAAERQLIRNAKEIVKWDPPRRERKK